MAGVDQAIYRGTPWHLLAQLAGSSLVKPGHDRARDRSMAGPAALIRVASMRPQGVMAGPCGGRAASSSADRSDARHHPAQYRTRPPHLDATNLTGNEARRLWDSRRRSPGVRQDARWPIVRTPAIALDITVPRRLTKTPPVSQETKRDVRGTGCGLPDARHDADWVDPCERPVSRRAVLHLTVSPGCHRSHRKRNETVVGLPRPPGVRRDTKAIG